MKPATASLSLSTGTSAASVTKWENVTLRAAQHASRDLPPPLTQRVTLRTVHYLYVEDNEQLRETITELMEAAHRRVTAVDSAEAALVAAETGKFDVLVTDVSLPGMSGTDLARHWLKDGPDRFVVLCSGYDFRHGLTAIGRNVRSLPKSFDLEELESLLGDIEAALPA